jgi:hypothetical protein
LAVAVSVTRTNNAEIDGLLAGTKWTGTITYSFPDSPSDYVAAYSSMKEPTTGFSQTPAAEQVAVTYAVSLILSYTNASIQYAGTNGADIQIARSSAANPTSYAYYPSNNTTGTGGDVWFGTTYDYSQAKLGNYYFVTALHELGHAFGLKHSQELGGVAGVAVPAAHDDSEFTVMSYRSYVGGPLTGYTNEAYGYPQTYMANDILALQTLYGANFATHAENTVYSWDPATGQEFINGVGQPAPGGGAGGSANRVFMTVWDGNGVDTYDLSNYSSGVSINLNPGASSITSTTQLAYLGNGHYAQGNIFNAYLYNGDARSYIENAIGGAGNDTIVGNAASNNLNGGAGNDTLSGGAGYNVIDGGTGTDTALFSGSSASYSVSYNSATQVFTVTDQRAGAPDGTDIIINVENFQFADGVFASSIFMVANHAPVVAVASPNVPVTAGQVLQASSLFSATDPDNDAVGYYVVDYTPAANSGHFVVNGTVVAAQTVTFVSAAQLAQTSFVAGSDGVSDDLWVRAFDGRAFSDWNEFHVNVDHAPVLTVASPNVRATAGQSLLASSLFSATDADNDAIGYYVVDYTPAANSGHFVINGTMVAAQTVTFVSAAQLAQTSFVAGSDGVSDDLYVQAFDGRTVSSWSEFHVNVDHAPVVTVASPNVPATAGQSLQASSLFSATDADNDAIGYYVVDYTPAANSGHFVVNGTAVAAQTVTFVSAAQLAQTSFVAGSDGVSDDLYVRAFDGWAFSDWSEFHVNVDHAPVVTVASPEVSPAPGQVLQASSLFSATDADNDAIGYYVVDYTPAANSGHFVINGTAVAAQTVTFVSAAQLAQTFFVAGGAGASDDLFVQATDGKTVSNWAEFHVNLNHAPVLTVAAPEVSATAGQVLQASSLFSAADADNDALGYYLFDTSAAANSGHFMVNGAVVPDNAIYPISAAQLVQTSFVAGSDGASDDLFIQATDGKTVSNWGEFHVNVLDPAPEAVANSGAIVNNSAVAGAISMQTSPAAGSGFAFVPGLGSNVAMEVISHIEAAVPQLHQDIAAAVGALETASPAIHADLLVQPHELQPAGHVLDYFIV